MYNHIGNVYVFVRDSIHASVNIFLIKRLYVAKSQRNPFTDIHVYIIMIIIILISYDITLPILFSIHFELY